MFNKKTVFYTACVCMFTFGISVICLGAILPEIVEKFGRNDLAAGGLAAILPFGILVGSLFCGPFADKNGYKGLFILCCALILAGMEGLAYGNSWLLIQLAVFLVGAGGGALNSSASALVADISEGERGAALSTLGIFYGLGALGLPSIISFLSAYYDSFAVVGGLGAAVLLVIVLVAFTTFPQAKQQGGFPIKEALQMIKNPILLLVGMVMFFQSGLEGLVSNWTNGFVQDTMQSYGELLIEWTINLGFYTKDITLTPKNAGLFGLTIHMAALTLMRVALGYLLKKYQNNTILNLCYGMMLLGCIILYFANSFALQLLALTFLGMGFAGIFPIFLGMAGDKFAHLSGTAFSIIFVIALFGNMLINYGMGVFSQNSDGQPLPILLLACTVLMGGFLVVTKRYFD